MLSVEETENSTPGAAPLSFKRNSILVGDHFVVFDEKGDEIDYGTVECIRYRLDGTAFAVVTSDNRVFALTPDADVTFYPNRIIEVSYGNQLLVFGLLATILS